MYVDGLVCKFLFWQKEILVSMVMNPLPRDRDSCLLRIIPRTSALGPIKISPSKAPAMTRICFGRPTLVNKIGKSDQDLVSPYKICLYSGNWPLATKASHLQCCSTYTKSYTNYQYVNLKFVILKHFVSGQPAIICRVCIIFPSKLSFIS